MASPIRPLLRWLRTPGPATPVARRARPRLSALEDRLTPATVDITADVVDATDNKTSLREAVELFNADPDDFLNSTISFAPDLKGATFTLTAGELAVTGKAGATNKLLTFTNNDALVTLSGNNASRVFNVGADAELTLSGPFRLTAGKALLGGAVLNAGTVSLTDVTIDTNEADEGGGIYNKSTGTVRVSNSVIADNKATGGGGGGILDFGGVRGISLVNSLVRGNTATADGGGILAGNLRLTNTTVTGNAADGSGGGTWTNGELRSVNSTIVLNRADADGNGNGTGGGVFISAPNGTAVLWNTLVGGNVVGKGATAGDIEGTVAGPEASKNNFVADPATAGGLVHGTNGNILGDGAGGAVAIGTVINPTLAANGSTGPFTHALVAGSPAIDAGDKTLAIVPGTTSPLTNDARGFPFARVAGANVDVGAFELQNIAPTVTVPTTKDAIPEDDPNGYTFTGAGKTFSIADDAGIAPNYTVTLASAKGSQITVVNAAGVTNLTGNGTGTVTFKAATTAAANAALDGLRFVAAPNQYSFTPGVITVTVNDGDATAPGGAKEGTATGGVVITPQVDPPTVTSPTTAPNTPVEVTFTRNAVDGDEVNYFKVTNVTGGTLTYVDPDDKTVTVAPGAVLPFSGSFFALTPDKATKLTFTPSAGFTGKASFDIQAAIGTYERATTTPPVFGGPVVTSTITVGTPVPADAAPPTAVLAAAPAVTDASNKTQYDFTVTYADNVGVNVATLDGKDVRVTGPNGFNQLAQFVGAAPAGNGTPRTATYRITAPGGTWDAADSGKYAIALEAGQVADAAGNATAAATLGTFTAAITPPNTAPTVSDIADPPAAAFGATVGPLAFTVGDAETAADKLTVTARSSNPALVSDAAIVLGGARRDRTVTVNPTAGRFGTAVVTVTVTDAGGVTATDTFTVTVTPRAVFQQLAVGAGTGSGVVRLLNADQTERFAADPFPGFAGGVRTAAADFNADGVADLVVGTGPGRATRVLVLDGQTKAELFAVDPFEASFTGGVYVAAGDLNRDGVPDLVITPDEGGGPRARVFSGAGFGQIADFFGIEDPNFRGGARAAVGDVTGDGVGDLVVVAGFGGGPRVSVWDGASLTGGAFTKKPFGDFLAFEAGLRNGVFIAAGDVDGDGFAEVIAGGGPGGGPRVSTFDGKDLTTQGGKLTRDADFFAGDVTNRAGVRVAVKDLDGDRRADVVAGAGTGAGSKVTAYAGSRLAGGDPPSLFGLDAFAGFAGGVFVG